MKILDTILDKIHDLIHGKWTEAEVSAKLDQAARETTEKLDWRNSIVDLDKLLDLPFDLATRKQFARECGYTGALDGSAEMNQFLHAETMKAIEEKYIRLPGRGDG